jgi:hypothetical protein
VLCHVILGFLRDGRARHGYELVLEYRARVGERVNAGNLYRERGRLGGQGLVRAGANAPGADSLSSRPEYRAGETAWMRWS